MVDVHCKVEHQGYKILVVPVMNIQNFGLTYCEKSFRYIFFVLKITALLKIHANFHTLYCRLYN